MNKHLFRLTILIFVLGFSSAKAQSYDTLWNRFYHCDHYRIADANAMLDTIVWKAQAENNEYQLLKVNHARVSLNRSGRRWDERGAILYLDSVRHFSGPLYQPIYDFSIGMLLDKYAVRYYSSNTDYKSDYRHLDEWSREALAAEADRLFQKAIDSSAPLVNCPLTNYQGPDYLFLLDVGYYSRNRYAYDCPTLFDLLVQSRIQQVEDHFRRDQAAALCDFAIRQHKLPEDRSLLIEYELERLEYLYIKDNPNDTAAYRRSLLDLEQRYGSDDAFTYAWALYIFGLGENRRADALSRFDSLILHSSDFFHINNANYYKEEILKKWLYVHEAQSDFQPSRYLPLCVSYCNVDSIYVSIYRTGVPLSIPFVKGKDRIPHLKADDAEQLQQLYRKQFFTLPTEYPYCLSSTDIWLDSLPIGSYVLVFHETPQWDTVSVLMVKTIQITDIQLTGWSDSRHFYFAANNRKTGEALANRRAVIRPYYIGLEHVRHSDEYGQFKMRRNISHGEWDGTIAMDFHNGRKDVYDTYYQEYRYRSHSMPHQDSRRNMWLAQIALDRTLYRPGQTAFYKVLIADKGQTIADREVFVKLKDGNNNVLDSVQMRTNEFGSVAGRFQLPKQVGNYVLEAYYYDNEKKKAPKLYATAEIEAAEYRLPTFKVEMQKDEREYAKGDTLLVSGFVRALSGVPLPDVSVHIRGFLIDQHQNVGYDTTVLSNSDGFFQCPILTQKGTTNLYGDVYDFTITATDVNGESQNATAEYTLSQYSLFLELAMDKAVDLQLHDTAFVKVSATNAAQCAVNTPVSVVIERLTLPDYYLGQMFPSGANPKQLQHSTEEYARCFPLQTLNQNALKVQCWPATDTMLNVHRAFDKQDELSLVVKDWPVGIYRITARSADAHGRDVVAQRYLQIYNSSSLKATRCEAVYAEILGEPALGDTMSILVGTYLKQAAVYCSVYQEDKKLVTQRLPLDCAQTILRVPTDSKCNTGVKVVVYAVQNGVSYSDVEYADLRWPFPVETNELNLSLTHWNKMVEPGSQQEWELYVENMDDSLPVVSEVLASMVDEAMYELRGGPRYEYIHSSFSKLPIHKLGKDIDLFGDVKSFSNHLFRCAMANPDNDYKLETKRFLRYGLSNSWKYHSSYQDSRMSADNLRTTPGRSASSNMEEVAIKYEPPVFLGGGKSDDKLPANARFAQQQPENTGLHLDDFGNSPRAKVLHEVEVTQKDELEEDSFDSSIRVRSHFEETAFFLPQLRTDSTGKVKFVFTVPDQFTRWGFYATAHTRDMHFGMTGEQIFSRRSLMIQSNCPRFLREGDTVSFAIRISNLCDTSLNGKAKVTFFDPATDKPLNILVDASDSLQRFACDGHGSTSVRWMVAVPERMEAVAYRVLAQSGNYGDGEEKAVPVLSTRMLFTESVPFYVPADTVRTVTFNKFRDTHSSTLQHLSYSLEVTTNPVWTAVASLPYLTADRWSGNDDVATALFANAIARHIVRNFPEIERTYAQWTEDTLMQSMESSLMRNEQFKNLQTEETPWMHFAQSERNQREAMAKFFKQTRIDADIQRYMMKLRANQLPDGGWDWFGRYSSSEYVTSLIVCHYQKLQRMHIEVPDAPLMMNRALVYLDTCAERRYKAFLKNKEKNPKLNYVLRSSDIRYLYARTFGSKDTSWLAQPFVKMLLEQVSKEVYDRPYSEQADVALVLHRMGRVREAREIMEAIRQQAHGDENLGMYWPTYAYENSIAQQSALMEAFSEISPREQELDRMRQWLLAQKQGMMWSNNPTTTEAVFALLMDDEQELLQPSQTEVVVGGETFTSANVPASEAGSGRFTRVWLGRDVSPALANVTVRTDSEHPATGSLYWQYYDVTDKADASGSGITIDRGLYHKDVVEERESLQEVTEERPARVGEHLVVRIVLRNDRTLNFVHLRDQRAAALESVNFREKHSFSGDISYYEIPRDASTDIFINILPAGTHIIEYEVVATQTGAFSYGIATAECAYAPEFRAQSQGKRIRCVKNNE